MKRYKSALVLLLILALMAGGYYFYTSLWPLVSGGDAEGADAEPTAPASTSVRLIDKKTDELTEFSVDYLSEQYVAVKETVMEAPEGGGKEREVTKWKLTNRDDFRADSSKLATAASNLCTITSSKVVEENAADLSQYGLGGAQSAKISGKFTDGTVAALEIGDKNPTRDGYYIRKNSENTVYLGSTYSAEKVMLLKSDIADLKLFALTEADVSRIEMSRGGKPLFAAWHKDEYQWELERPVIAPLNSTAQGQIFTSVQDLSAASYEEIGAKDLSTYGLDAPRYTLLFELEGGGDPVELLIGKEKSVRTTVYAMLGGTSDVFVMDLTNFVYLDKPMKEFVDVFAYIVNINQVNHIQANFDGMSVGCDIFAEAGKTDEDKFIVDGVDVTTLETDKSKSYFRAYYQALIGVTIYDIEPDATPEGVPEGGSAEVSFLYDLKEAPHTMLVEFVPKDERLYYVFRNKKYAGIITEKRLFDKPEEGLRATYAAMKTAMDNIGNESE